MKFLRIALITVMALVFFVVGRWYTYVSNSESPYEEVGIALNSRMPEPIRKWGCDRLHATFGNGLPPYGCQSSVDASQWL
jgi:hypothetical protein